MKKSHPFYYLGISLFSLCLGILIALSKSPVLGIVITSLFGLGGSLAGVLLIKKGNQPISINYNLVGLTLSFFSVFIIAGIVVAIIYKNSGGPVSKKFLWQSKDQPESIREALDWIMVDDILLSRGYSQDQIARIYQMRKRETLETLDTLETLEPGQKNHIDAYSQKDLSFSYYDASNPYYSILLNEKFKESDLNIGELKTGVKADNPFDRNNPQSSSK